VNETATTWSTWHQAVSVIAAPRQLKKTASVALIVGSAFFAMNQLSVIVAGQATAIVWLKAALTYLTPLLVSSFGVLSATRQSAASSPSPEHPARVRQRCACLGGPRPRMAAGARH
jgi:hypothetical protein